MSRICICKFLLRSSNFFLLCPSSSTSIWQPSSRSLPLLASSLGSSGLFTAPCCLLTQLNLCTQLHDLFWLTLRPPFFSSAQTRVPFSILRVHRLLVLASPQRCCSQRLQRHRVHTLVSEQNLQIHSFLPSIVIASARSLSALTWPDTQDFTTQEQRKDSRQDRDRTHKEETVAGTKNPNIQTQPVSNNREMSSENGLSQNTLLT